MCRWDAQGVFVWVLDILLWVTLLGLVKVESVLEGEIEARNVKARVRPRDRIAGRIMVLG